ncbi:MAG TPA: serine/threonine-protein phosphatase [Candidatus Hydrogenedentes bacterium]|nr:serine/threonine-protein phosphatase [Candidatus Hydrogenedentota bacterium]
MMKTVRVCGVTDPGAVRTENQDMLLLGRVVKNTGYMEMAFGEDDDFMVRYGFLAAVADGLGGHASGQLAARIALRGVDQQFYGAEKNGQWPPTLAALRQGGDRGNFMVRQVSEAKPEHAGMGCVIAGVCLLGAEYVVYHAGDSRVCRFRRGALRQLTEDDTVVGMAVREGQLTPAQASSSKMRHLVTNGIGTASFTLHISEPQTARSGDILLVSSDGLHDVVSMEDTERVLADKAPLLERANRLKNLALDGGGPDNISIVLIEYSGGEPEPDMEP